MPSRAHKPRVAFLGYAHDARGGIAQFGRKLAGVVSDRAAIKLIGYRKLYPAFTAPGRQGPDPSSVIAGPTGSSITVPWSPPTWRATSDEIAAFGADLLVVQWWSPICGPSVRSIVRRARAEGTRTLLVCHNDRPHEPFPLWRQITRAALAQADILATFTEPVADRLRALAPGRVVEVRPLPQTLVQSGGDTSAYWDDRLGERRGPVILFFGNVRAYKGLQDLVAALPRVLEQADARLVIAGTFFEPLERYHEQARALGVEDRIDFVPDYVADEHVAGLFARCDVVALPYRSATASAILGQAAVAGKPVVATTVGALPAMLGKRGILVPPRDPAALADGIVRALNDPPPPPHLDESAWDRWRDLVLTNAVKEPTWDYATT